LYTVYSTYVSCKECDARLPTYAMKKIDCVHVWVGLFGRCVESLIFNICTSHASPCFYFFFPSEIKCDATVSASIWPTKMQHDERCITREQYADVIQISQLR